MAVEVARLGRKRFENVGAVDGPEVEGSVRPRSLVLSMQPVDSCSSDDRACDHCQSQCDRSIHGALPLAFCEGFQYAGADGNRYTKPRSTLRSSFVPADGTGAASCESGDFSTSPFFLVSSQASRGPPVHMYLWCREQSTMAVRRLPSFYFDLRLISSTSSRPALPSIQLSPGSHSSADLQSVRAGKGTTLAVA